MSTRPEPEDQKTVGIATRNVAIPGSVRLAQAHPLTKPTATRNQPWSSYGPPYPFGRWSSALASVYYVIFTTAPRFFAGEPKYKKVRLARQLNAPVLFVAATSDTLHHA